MMDNNEQIKNEFDATAKRWKESDPVINRYVETSIYDNSYAGLTNMLFTFFKFGYDFGKTHNS